MPRGWWLHEVRRWECCGLRHRQAESRFSGVFIIAVHRAFVLGLGTRHRGIVDLSEGVIRCVTVFACYSSSSSSSSPVHRALVFLLTSCVGIGDQHSGIVRLFEVV